MGEIAQAVGKKEITVSNPDSYLAKDVLGAIRKAHGEFDSYFTKYGGWRGILVLSDKTIVHENTILDEDSEITIVTAATGG